MLNLRALTAADAAQVAGVHAESWRSAYRGILPDSYLDRDVDAERLVYWENRLNAPGQGDCGVLALNHETPVGFGFAIANESPAWGHLLDNLHVLSSLRGMGVGRALLLALTEALGREAADNGLHLWVYAANHAACRFCARLGASQLHSEVVDIKGGGRTLALVFTGGHLRWDCTVHGFSCRSARQRI